ncbi:MAG: nucleoside deaminase [Pseudonocardiaceae bacterium]
MEIAIHEARESLSEGGVPIGAVLARGDTLSTSGHNERVQRGDPIARGEISCLRNGGRREPYGNMTLYTALSPCEIRSGAILLFKIPRLIVGEATRFRGDLDPSSSNTPSQRVSEQPQPRSGRPRGVDTSAAS